MSRLETQTPLKLQRESTDLAVLIGDVVRGFGGAAQAGGIALAAAHGEDLPLVEIDPVRIREVLANLVSNALRHTPRGGRITIAAEASPEGVTVRVQASGSGISAEDLPKVFDRFAKGVDSSGSGLGLAIARKLVEAHGGDIQVDSQRGQGTTFTFSLPA